MAAGKSSNVAGNKTMSETRKYLRFTLSDRIEHWLQVVSFTTLAVTGLVQKYAENSVSQGLISLMAGIESVRLIHRISAVVLMVGVVYHIGTVGYKLFVRRVQPSILPSLEDIKAAWQALLYNLGLREHRPQQGRYTFDEKAEYWAFVWGTVVMVVTGFMMWNPIATARFFPGQFIPAAKAAHGGEALLAVLAIIVWHMYHVHIKHFNRSMFTGYLSEEEMVHDHALELADIKAGEVPRTTDPEKVRSRLRVFLPVYGVLATALLFGIYGFVTFEQTAIETVPPAEQVVVFAPQTPTPLPTPLPTQPPPQVAGSWEAGIGQLFQEKCGSCHTGAAALGGLDLSTYESALAGGNSGPAIIPENLDDSQLIVIQARGGHPGQFSGEELALIRDWIEAGAPEQ
jgi:formate dehydrogenase gamma subunit